MLFGFIGFPPPPLPPHSLFLRCFSAGPHTKRRKRSLLTLKPSQVDQCWVGGGGLFAEGVGDEGRRAGMKTWAWRGLGGEEKGRRKRRADLGRPLQLCKYLGSRLP